MNDNTNSQQPTDGHEPEPTPGRSGSTGTPGSAPGDGPAGPNLARAFAERFRPVQEERARGFAAAFAQPVIAEQFSRGVLGPLHESMRQAAATSAAWKASRVAAGAFGSAQSEQFRGIKAAMAQTVSLELIGGKRWSAEQFSRQLFGPLHESMRQAVIPPVSPAAAVGSTASMAFLRLQTERNAVAYRADLAATALLEEVREQRRTLREQGEAIVAAVEQILRLVQAQDAACREARRWQLAALYVALAAAIIALLAWQFPRSPSPAPPNIAPTVTVPSNTSRVPVSTAPPRPRNP